MTDKQNANTQIRIEQVKQLYMRLPLSAVMTLIIASILAIVQYGIIDQTTILIWWGAIVFITILRWIQVAIFKKTTITEENINHWSTRFLIGTICAGLAWGATAFHLFPEDNISHQLFVILVIAGMSSAGMTTLASQFINAAIFLCLMIIPILVKLFIMGDEHSIITGLIAVAYLIGLIFISKRTHNIITESLTLRIENIRKEKKLNASEKRYYSLVENLPIGIFRVIPGKEVHFDMVNSPIASMFGYESITDFSKVPIEEFFVDKKEFRTFNDQLLLGEKIHTREFKLRKKNREEFWCALTTSTVRINKDKIDYFDGIVEDITDRRKIENELRESEEKFSKAFQVSSMFISITTINDGRFLDINDAALKSLGYRRDEIIGKTVNDLNIYTDQSQRESYLKLIKEKGHVRDFELNFQTKNKDIRFGLLSSDVITLNKKQFLLSIINDITERKKAEENLRKLSLAVEQSPVTVAITDIEGNLEYVNNKFVQLTGYSREEVIGENPRILKSGKHSEGFYKKLWQTIMSGKEWQGKFHNKKKNGELFWESAYIAPIKDENGDTTHFLALKEDITAKKEADEELQKAKSAAEAANRSKSEFLANMSHEIRTPMNAILGTSEVLMDRLKDTKEKKLITAILSSGQLLLELINDILDLSKIEAGKMKINYNPVYLKVVLKEIEDIFSGKINSKGLRFEIDINQNVPEVVLLDETRVRQILFNLIGNAIKFTEKGYVRMAVSYKKSVIFNKFQLIFKIEDSGIGIPADQQKIIFDAFQQQSGQSTRKFEGTGLGLTIAKKLTEMLNGEITLKSKPNKGTCFKVILKDVKKVKAGEIHIVDRDKDETQVIFKPAKIMIVDEVLSNIQVIKDLLENHKLSFLEAETGEIALKKLKDEKPDLILMDLRLPGISGYQVVEKIRKNPSLKTIPVIAFTAVALKEEEDKLINQSFDGYLQKPVTKNLVYTEFKRFLPFSNKAIKKVKPKKEKIIVTEEQRKNLPHVIKIIEDKYLPKWKEIENDLVIYDIKAFVDDLLETAKKYKLTILQDYCEKLLEHIQSFDIENIEQFIKKFPDIIEKIRRLNS